MGESPEATVWENNYYEGAVRSKHITIDGFKATKGEIDPGTYSFATGSREKLKCTNGEFFVTLSGATEEIKVGFGEEIEIPGKSSFEIKVEGSLPSSYTCVYLDEPVQKAEEA
jgi:purine/pyrimidine-nucleoside phosphorylase